MIGNLAYDQIIKYKYKSDDASNIFRYELSVQQLFRTFGFKGDIVDLLKFYRNEQLRLLRKTPTGDYHSTILLNKLFANDYDNITVEDFAKSAKVEIINTHLDYEISDKFKRFMGDIIEGESDDFYDEGGEFVTLLINDKYEICTTGQHIIRHKETGEIIPDVKSCDGYVAVSRCIHPKGEQILKHRLIANQFLGMNLSSRYVVDHIKGNKKNNNRHWLNVVDRARNWRNNKKDRITRDFHWLMNCYDSQPPEAIRRLEAVGFKSDDERLKNIYFNITNDSFYQPIGGNFERIGDRTLKYGLL